MFALPVGCVKDVTKLNAAISSNSELQGKSLEEIMATATGGVFNNAAQVNFGGGGGSVVPSLPFFFCACCYIIFILFFLQESLSRSSDDGEPTGAIKESVFGISKTHNQSVCENTFLKIYLPSAKKSELPSHQVFGVLALEVK